MELVSAGQERRPIFLTRGLTRVFLDGQVEVRALRGIDLELHASEFVALLGASNSGKSTLLNILGGLDTGTALRWRAAAHLGIAGAAHALREDTAMSATVMRAGMAPYIAPMSGNTCVSSRKHVAPCTAESAVSTHLFLARHDCVPECRVPGDCSKRTPLRRPVPVWHVSHGSLLWEAAKMSCAAYLVIGEQFYPCGLCSIFSQYCRS